MGQFPVFIKLRHSLSLSAVLVAMHLAAMACLFLLQLSWWVYAPALLLLAFSFWRSWQAFDVTTLILSANEGLSCVKADGSRVKAAVLADSAVFVWLVTLRFRMEGEAHIRTLALLPDHMSGDEFRLLRLWLRWNSHPGEERP